MSFAWSFTPEVVVEVDSMDTLLDPLALRRWLDLVRQDAEVDSFALAPFVEGAVLVSNHSSIDGHIQHARVEPPFGELSDATEAQEHGIGSVQMAHELLDARAAHEIQRVGLRIAQVAFLLDAVAAEAVRPSGFENRLLEGPLQLRFLPGGRLACRQQLRANLLGMAIVVRVGIVDATDGHGEGRKTSKPQPTLVYLRPRQHRTAI